MATPLQRFLTNFPAAKQAGKDWTVRCPAHEDHRASLSIGEGQDGRVLIKCHAGCKTENVCAAVGLTVLDLMPTADTLTPPSKSNGEGISTVSSRKIVALYDYLDETGRPLFQVVRFDPKDFRQRKPDARGGWTWSVKGVRTVPYHLPQLLADPSSVVIVAEGEKDCDNLTAIGMLATCNAGGAGKWTPAHAAFLRGRTVVVLPDNDEAGRAHARQVALSLQGVAASVRIVELPNLPPKEDASHWLEAGGTRDQLKRLIEAAPEWTPSTEPWPEMVALDVQDLPPFPTQALPEGLGRWVEAESHATQTPPDLAALLVLAVCSACLARRVEVEARPGWREPVNIFVAVFLEPGNRKSAVFADATKPLREIEVEQAEAARPVLAREQSDRRQKEARLKKLEKTAAENGDADAGREAGELAVQLAAHPAAVSPRLLVDDSTAEKLVMMLAEHGGRIASMSPEGGVFDLMAGTYSKNGAPQFNVYLMGHSGDELITDRVSRDSVRVERPALTCAYAMQPSVLKVLGANAAFRGRGLLARFLYASPASWIGHREVAPAPVSEDVREAYRQKVRELAAWEGELVLRLAEDAESLLRTWELEIETMLRDGGTLEMMRDWGAKLAGATLRLAAVLHCVEHGPAGQVAQQTVEAAVTIARYLVPHASAVLNMMTAGEDSTEQDARYVLRWIGRHGLREFAKREAQQHGKRRFPKADDIDAALSELTRRGYIREKPMAAKGPGRPASPAYEVNPAFTAGSEPQQRSHNSRNSGDDGKNANCGNNESASAGFETPNRLRVTI